VSGQIPKSMDAALKQLLVKNYTVHVSKPGLARLGWTEKELTAQNTKSVVVATEAALVNLIKDRKIDLVFNFNVAKEEPAQYDIRRASVDFSTPLMTNEKVAVFMCEAISRYDRLPVESYEDFYSRQSADLAAGTTFVDL